MSRAARAASRACELFGEKDFYLEEFRGRSVLIALAPSAATAARRIWGRSPTTVADLVRNGTRVLLWWPATGVGRPSGGC